MKHLKFHHPIALTLSALLLACGPEGNRFPEEQQAEAEQLLAADRFTEAIAIFERGVAADPGSATLCAQLAGAYAADDRATAAIDEYERCLELSPDDVSSRVALARLLLRLDLLPEAEGHLEAALERQPGQAEALRLRGSILLHQARFEEAEASFQRAVKADSTFGEAWEGLAQSRLKAGHLAAAEEAFRQALAMDATNAAYHDGLGEVLFKNRDYEGAAAEMEEAVRLDSLDSRAHFHLGNAYLRLGRHEEGKRQLQRYRVLDDQERRIYALEVAVLKAPDQAQPYHELGVLHTKRGETAKAQKRYIQAILRDSTSAASFHNLGSIQLRQGKLVEAMGLYRRALRADSSYLPAYRSLGNVYMRQQYVQAAVETFRAGLRLDPSNTDLERRLRLAEEALPLPDQVLVRVGSQVVSIGDFERRISALFTGAGRQPPVMDLTTKRRYLDGIITQELLVDESLRQGADTDGQLTADLADAEYRTLEKALYEMEGLNLETASSRQELRSYYDEHQYGSAVKTRQIVCETSAEAEQIIEGLTHGADFDSLLNLHTREEALRRYGLRGSTGWVRAGELDESLRVPVVNMPVGSVYPEPVRTGLGYHVILLEGRRSVPFSSSIDFVRRQLQQRKRLDAQAAFVAMLRERYRVTVDATGLAQLAHLDMAAPTTDQIVMTWTGGALRLAEYADLARNGRAPDPATTGPAALSEWVSQYADRQILRAEARTRDVHHQPGVRHQLADQRRQLLARWLFERELPRGSETDPAAMARLVRELRTRYADQITVDEEALARVFRRPTRVGR